jgi:DNA helicase-2/ATP-dependent DNA helicase PcrA
MALRLDELNPPQREAATTIDGPLLVLAGAGSGKTRVITYRVAYLLERGIRPEQILAVSFTNKSADEMEERVGKLVGPRARLLTLSTFHSLGLMILKAEREALSMASGFTIYDQADQMGLLRELLRQVHIEDRRFDVKAILFRISLAKNAFLSPEVYAARVREDVRDDEYDLIAAEMYPRYEAQLQQLHALDFDDLITRTVRLIDENEGVRARWGNRFHYVMVDEYQDTNRAQFKLMEHLVRAKKNLCVVGDDDQSIYGWRGAEAGHILEFERQFPGAKVVRLEENYRSTPQILNAANGVISHNVKRHKKTLWTARPPGEKLRLIVADDAEAEAKFVAEEIELLRATRNYKLSDCAVLYRSNIQARALEEALRAQRLEYEVVGGQSFFERKEVKDAIAYLKLAMHPRDEIALRRIINYPARGIGATTVDKLAEWAKANGKTLTAACEAVAQAHVLASGDGPMFGGAEEVSAPQLEARQRQAVAGFSDLMQRGRAQLGSGVLLDGVRAFLKETGIDEDIRASAPSGVAAQRRLENLEGFLLSLGRFQERAGAGAIDALGAYLHRLMLKSQDDDAEAEEQDRITLVTLHGSKGLEFPVVFIVGMEEELLPHRRTLYPQGPDVTQASAAGVEIDLGEERRLLYVGITRAREQLYLTRCRARTSRASQKPRAPSRFLEEIPPELIELREASAPAVAVEDEDAFARASLEKLRQMMAD